MPIANDIYMSVDRNAVYVPRARVKPNPEVIPFTAREPKWLPSQRSSPRPTTHFITERPRTGADRPPFADEWVAKITAFRETLTRANPDVLVLVGSDHFHQLWLDNMPQFLVGKAPFYDANWYNEEREFGLPKMLFTGQEDLSAHILRTALTPGSTSRSATSCGSTTASPAR